jgi:hypothetical protein
MHHLASDTATIDDPNSGKGPVTSHFKAFKCVNAYQFLENIFTEYIKIQFFFLHFFPKSYPVCLQPCLRLSLVLCPLGEPVDSSVKWRLKQCCELKWLSRNLVFVVCVHELAAHKVWCNIPRPGDKQDQPTLQCM